MKKIYNQPQTGIIDFAATQSICIGALISTSQTGEDQHLFYAPSRVAPKA
ncbi:MAG: hypothetical protein MJZ75_04250 [Paludibacteraceae bacterium]|nr:hypothetical protein [Paludibacteraceae bacterium]